MVTAEYITQQDERYGEVCAVASKIYAEILGARPLAFPPAYLAFFDRVPAGGDLAADLEIRQKQQHVVGSVGIWRGDQKNPFTVEEYCRSKGVNVFERAPFLQGIARIHWAEIGDLNMLEYYRSQYVAALFRLICRYCLAQEIYYVFVTRGLHLVRNFNRLGIKPVPLCDPDSASLAVCAAEKAKWEKVYYNKLKPKCVVVDIAGQAMSPQNTKIKMSEADATLQLQPILRSMLEAIPAARAC